MRLKRYGWLVSCCALGMLINSIFVNFSAAQISEQSKWVELVKSVEQDPAVQKTKVLAMAFIRSFPTSRYVPVAEYILGEHYFINQQYVEALQFYEKNSKNQELRFLWESAMYRRGECLYSLGDRTQARDVWDELIAFSPATHFKAEIEANHCQELINAGEYQTAGRYYKKITSDFPFYRENPKLLLGLAKIDYAGQKYAQAMEWLKTSLLPEALYLKGNCIFALRKYQALINIMDEVKKRGGRTADVFNEIQTDWCLRLYEQKQYAMVLSATNMILPEDKTITEENRKILWLLQGLCYMQMEQYEKAQEILLQVLSKITQESAEASVKILLGVTYYKMNAPDKAVALWDSVFNSPDSTGVDIRDQLSYAADLLLIDGRYAVAGEYLKLFIRRNPAAPRKSSAYNRLSLVYYKLGQDQLAMGAYKDYLRCLPVGQKMEPVKIDPRINELLEIAQCPLLQNRQQIIRKSLLKYERGQSWSQSQLTSSPWLSLISEIPVLTIRVQKPSFGITAWKLEVVNATGELLFSRSSTDGLPEKIIWDGYLTNGRMISVGEQFAYRIILNGKGGKPLTTVSNLKMINGLFYFQARTPCIELRLPILLDKEKPGCLSRTGVSLLNETCDRIIRYIKQSLVINLYTQDAEAGLVQADLIKKYLRKKIALPEDMIQIKVIQDKRKTENYVELLLP